MFFARRFNLCVGIFVCFGLAELSFADDHTLPKTVSAPYVEFVGYAFGGLRYETLTGVDISISEQTHPVPGAMYFMVSHNNVILRPQLSFGPDANGNQVPSGTLSVGILLADFVEAGISLKGGSTTVKYSADGQSAEETQSSRTIGIYARAHIATSDELSLEAGGGLGVGLSNYESDLSGTDESSSSTSFEAGINIKSVYHLSEHLDLIATFAFIFSRVPVVADDQQGDSDDAIAVYSYAFSPLGLRLKF